MLKLVGRWTVAALVVGLLGACGGSSNASAESAADPSPDIAQNETPAGDESSATDTGTADSGDPKSLDDYLGLAANVVRSSGGRGAFGVGLGDADQDQIIEQQRLIEQETQVCMQAQGFVYVPEQVDGTGGFFQQTTGEGTSPADYAATEGFGISTRFDAILDGDVDLTEDTSPNDDYVATLSEGEADAWQVALRGQPPERNDAGQLIDPETGEPVQGGGRGLGTGGCQGEAQTSVRGDFSALGELSDEFAELTDRIESDPRVAEIRREWTDCMRVEGFDYTDESEARADISSQVRPLLRSFFGGQAGVGQDAAAPQGRAGGGNQLRAVAGLELSPEQEAELEALQDLERSIAVAALTCEGDTGAEVDEITAGYEAEFVEVNRTALEAFAS